MRLQCSVRHGPHRHAPLWVYVIISTFQCPLWHLGYLFPIRRPSGQLRLDRLLARKSYDVFYVFTEFHFNFKKKLSDWYTLSHPIHSFGIFVTVLLYRHVHHCVLDRISPQHWGTPDIYWVGPDILKSLLRVTCANTRLSASWRYNQVFKRLAYFAAGLSDLQLLYSVHLVIIHQREELMLLLYTQHIVFLRPWYIAP